MGTRRTTDTLSSDSEESAGSRGSKQQIHIRKTGFVPRSEYAIVLTVQKQLIYKIYPRSNRTKTRCPGNTTDSKLFPGHPTSTSLLTTQTKRKKVGMFRFLIKDTDCGINMDSLPTVSV
ncbi:hypothetical protein CEXT_43061 [Caerostris extrusa]|uniref:Uncharacterized protein n=1 Tax=Caerostris extrusa TaxID=172846 RepID=A0AAV4WJY7_CAEEX|nr:hypothetical protein CEXT_43061 [Caerostris extrusa]